MKKIDKYVRYMVDNGLVFEINRKVLHPLGLALDVGIHPENSKWLAINGLVSVDDDDDEGFIFDEETFSVGSDRYKIYLAKTGQKKLNSRKEKLGYIVQENTKVSLIDFHCHVGIDHLGRTLNDYFNFSFDQMENIHDYIQWIFPNKTPSSINVDAPVLTNKDIEFFSENTDHVKCILEWFCEFLFAPENINNIFNSNLNHNHLRITRILTFLTETKNRDLAVMFYNNCIAKINNIKDFSLQISYWNEALDIKNEL